MSFQSSSTDRCPVVSQPMARLARLCCLSLSVLMGAVWGCNDLSGLSGKEQLPAGTPDPGIYRTASGALSLYQTTLAAFQATNGVPSVTIGSGTSDTTPGAFVAYVLLSGLFTDELQAGDLGCTGFSCTVRSDEQFDARQVPEGVQTDADALYGALQGIRNDAGLGIGALAAYDSSASPALRGHLYALSGYAEIMLADFFCSGVPLSTLNFAQSTSFTYAASSTITQVYQDAIAKLDTAVTLSGDSARIQNMARVVKGRAWLNLGQFDSAETAVADVPDGFIYQFLVNWTGGTGSNGGGAGCDLACTQLNGLFISTETDKEGNNGLPFISSGDPRTAAQVAGTNQYGVPQYVPLKYGGAALGLFPITAADWIEARLIRAEVALQKKDYTAWLAQLNTLRETAHVTGQTTALPDTTDPGDSPGDSARASLLFHERAYWLFLTGHRQSDLHRLIRQYHRVSTQVYPSGPYTGGQLPTYDHYTDVPIPSTESRNPKFHGCLSRGT